MKDPGAFDHFYREARDRLLVQTYALTGDATAARTAVRDAFVVSWHHWRKVARTDDPEATVRVIAWGKARRRHGARPWHRDKGVSPEARASLQALSALSATQRRVLVLAQLATVSLSEMAREAGLPQEEAEKQLQLATSEFALARDVPTTAVTSALEPLAEVVDDAGWPRATIIRRAGVARRRTHTSVGALGGVAALVLSGVFVTDASGLRPTLDRALTGSVAAPGEAEIDGSAGAEELGETEAEAPAELLPATAMLSAEQVGRRVAGGGWAVRRTGDNSEGNGLVATCQQERYADPNGEAALVRVLRGAAPEGTKTGPRTVQVSEASSSPRAARRAYRTFTSWFAGCPVPRMQLLDSRTITGVGDESRQLVLRDWSAPVTTTVAQVSRTGSFTTVTTTTTNGDDTPDLQAMAGLQGAAVDGLCELKGGGECTSRPRLVSAAPPPTGEAPSMLAVIDLPPVSGVAQPWVGTDPREALDNTAATGCDEATFTGKFQGARFRQNMTRTFLVPEAKLPTEFGLTESIGSLPAPQAKAFVAQVRNRIAGCPDRDLGTQVTQVAEVSDGPSELTAWQLTTEVSDQRSLRFSMAVLRRGTTVAQVGFVPTGDVAMQEGAFVDLANRALARLAEMPELKTGAASGDTKKAQRDQG